MRFAFVLLSGCSGLLDLPASRMDASAEGGGACEACAVDPCEAPCGSTGTRQCAASGAGFGDCMPPHENCDVQGDESCDGLPDAEDPCCQRPSNYRCDVAQVIPSTGGVFEGCSQAAENDTLDSCSRSAGPDVFYSLTLGTTADIDISLAGSAFDTVVYVRSGLCDVEDATIACNDDEPAGGCSFESRTSRLSLPGLAAGTYFIVVDSPNGAESGSYRLEVGVQ